MDEDDSKLPGPVRDHLGQRLRAVYAIDENRPKFLGEEFEAPTEFAPQIEKLATRLKTHGQGTVAVEQALDEILDTLDVTKRPQG